MTLQQAIYHENAVLTQQIIALEVHHRNNGTQAINDPAYLELLRQKASCVISLHEFKIEYVLNQLYNLIF